MRSIAGTLLRVFTVMILMSTATGPTLAQSLFGEGWRLDPAASRLFFQTIKNNAIVETSNFATFTGEVSPEGAAKIEIQLNSVDTGIDLRNVRMRFLFFETFTFPAATITADIDGAALTGMLAEGRQRMTLDIVLDLHGIQQAMSLPIVVTRYAPNRVAVASAEPILIEAKSFGLDEGVLKLEDAAKVDILPAGSVSFDFVFARDSGAGGAPSVAKPAEKPPEATALETAGDFTDEACVGRFEILSRTGAINFQSGSAALADSSTAVLTTLLDIVKRCPKLSLKIEGHTDSVGAAETNQRLSEARAAAVADYLAARGVEPARMTATGHGESQPLFPNDTERNRRLNRRIQFLVDPS